MQLSKKINPISYLKANAEKLAEELNANGESYLITQNGEAAIVVHSIQEYELSQDTLAMQKMLIESEENIQQGKLIPVDEAFSLLKKHRAVNSKAMPTKIKT